MLIGDGGDGGNCGGGAGGGDYEFRLILEGSSGEHEFSIKREDREVTIEGKVKKDFWFDEYVDL